MQNKLKRTLINFRKHPNDLLRRATQFVLIVVILVAAYRFAGFVEAVRAGAETLPYRPPVIEGFLPIAAIVAFRGWLANGIFDPIHPAGLVILLATLATAFLFRRALCGWFCPIGALSEFLSTMGSKLKLPGIKKAIGAKLLPRWLDRVLLAGKYLLFAYIFKIFFLMPGGEALSFMRSPYYAISDIKMFELFAKIGPTGFAVIAALTMLSLFIKSFWCRYLCPYGALLGVASLVSPLLLKRDDKVCIDCGKCAKVCPNRVEVDRGSQLIVTAECMGCTTCVSACPKGEEGALGFSLFGIMKVKPLVVGVLFLLVFFTFVTVAIYTGHWDSALTTTGYHNLSRIIR